MEELGKIFISAGEGTLFLIFLLVGATIAWVFHKAHPRLSRWAALALMAGGIALGHYSLPIGLYLAIIGAILQGLCEGSK